MAALWPVWLNKTLASNRVNTRTSTKQANTRLEAKAHMYIRRQAIVLSIFVHLNAEGSQCLQVILSA
jgi:hypothetical protein